MKNQTLVFGIFLLMLFLFSSPANAQLEAIMDVQVESCFSDGGCEVVTRQYTGLHNFYSINIRCMDSAGNFGAWQNWEYEGINNASYCN